MRLLLDTHVLIWWLEDDPRLRSSARALIAKPNADVFFSIVSCWEASLKARKGKIKITGSAMWRLLLEEGFEPIGLAANHIVEMEKLPVVAGNGDPFDYLLLAQAKAEGAALMTADRMLTEYGVPCIGTG